MIVSQGAKQMTTATDRQIGFITKLVSQAGFSSNIEAVNAYGLGLKAARDLTVSEASQMIEWLLSGASPIDTAPALETGTEFKSAQGQGRVTTRLSDGRYLVKFSDGRTGFLAAADIAVA